MTARHSFPAGTIHRLTVKSDLLKGNLLDDPTERVIDVASAIGWDEEVEWDSQYRELYGGHTEAPDAAGADCSAPVPSAELDDVDPLS